MDQVMNFVVENVAPKAKVKASKALVPVSETSLPVASPAPWEALFGKVGEAAVRVRLAPVEGDKVGNRRRTQLTKMAIPGAKALEMGATMQDLEQIYAREVRKGDAVINLATGSLGITEI